MNSQVSVATYMYDKATCSVYNREILVVIDLILQILFGLGDRLNFVIWKELYLLARLSLEWTNLIITEYGSLTPQSLFPPYNVQLEMLSTQELQNSLFH